MLEEIKEVLINEREQEINSSQIVYKEINKLIKHRDLKQKQAIEKLTNLEEELKRISKGLFDRILNIKRINQICNNYTNLSKDIFEEINQLNVSIDELYRKINYEPTNNSEIEEEIKRISEANSLEELGLTEKTALQYIKNDEIRVIRSVFKDLKDKYNLTTKEDIDNCLNKLYRVNVSPFVTAIQKINFKTLIHELVDIGIIVDDNKIKVLEKLTQYDNLSEEEKQNIKYNKEKLDYLDNYFYNQVEIVINNMNRYKTFPKVTVSKIVTLGILISMAKNNKK